jgi:hypothetical protein
MNIALERTRLLNESSLDRMIRLFLGIGLVQLAFFWLGGFWQIAFYVLGAVLLFTAAMGFCPLYKVFGFATYRAGSKQLGRVAVALLVLLLALVLVAGSYASAFFSRKFFLDDFNHMNNFYKQTLFTSGQQDRAKAVENYEQLMAEYAEFQSRYSAYHPYAIKGDLQFNGDLQKVGVVISDVADQIHTGDLTQAHIALEAVRPVFQEILKRNNLSMLAVALVDFHDAMELILDAANVKDPQQVIAIYPEVSSRLATVEAEANDPEIQAIRQNLDRLLSLAQTGAADDLSVRASELKSSFVKVYLKRG